MPPTPRLGSYRQPAPTGVDFLAGHLDDTDVTVVAATISETLAPHVRDGLARRRIALCGGQCPCGATAAVPADAERRAAAGEPVEVTVAHARRCSAVHPDVLAAARFAFHRGGGDGSVGDEPVARQRRDQG